MGRNEMVVSTSEVKTRALQTLDTLHEDRSSKRGRRLSRKLGVVAGTGTLAYVLYRETRRRYAENFPHAEALVNTAQDVKKAEELPHAFDPIYLSEERLREIGLQIGAYADSGVLRNENAKKEGLPEKWTHKGTLPVLLKDAFHEAGFENVEVVSHAVAGYPSRKILREILIHKEEIVKDKKDFLGLLLMGGNDFRGAATGENRLDSLRKTLEVAAVVQRPDLVNIRRFRRTVWDPITQDLTKNEVEALRQLQEMCEIRDGQGLKTNLGILTPTQFHLDIGSGKQTVIWTERKGKPDRRVMGVPNSEKLVRGGNMLNAAVVTAKQQSLSQFIEDQEKIPEAQRLPFSVIPGSSIGEMQEGRTADDIAELFDGTQHLSEKGHEAYLQLVLKQIVIVSADGQKRTLEEILEKKRAIKLALERELSNH